MRLSRTGSSLLLINALACASPRGGPSATLPCAGSREVHEIERFQEALADVGAETLLVVDIDNTLIEPASELGSDQWYYALVDQLKEREHLDYDLAAARAEQLWNEVQEAIHVRLVEPDTDDLLGQLQAQGVQTLVVTARSTEIAQVTLRQLRSVGLRFGAPPFDRDRALSPTARLEGGVLFVGEQASKGDMLWALLRALELTPREVRFVDDKLRHAESVRSALAAAGTCVLSFRYGAADARVRSFRPEVAERELAAWRARTSTPTPGQ